MERADQTQRLRKLATSYWLLGMSLRSVALALTPFGIRLSHRSVWRDLQEQANLLEPRRCWKAVRGLGVDESNPQAGRRFLQPLVQPLGVSVLGTDDLAGLRTVAGKLGLEQQVCQFHVRRWVHRRLPEQRECLPPAWLWVLDEVKSLLAELPVEGKPAPVGVVGGDPRTQKRAERGAHTFGTVAPSADPPKRTLGQLSGV